MNKSLSILKQAFKEKFNIDDQLLGEENKLKFEYIFKNEKEVYFIKIFKESTNYNEIIEYESYILDYQYKILSNNNFTAYNLNYIIITEGEIDANMRIKLEKDKYTCRKIVLSIEKLNEDIYLLPFMKKGFEVGEIGIGADKILVEKCNKIKNISDMLSILKKDKLSEEEIQYALDLVGGDINEQCQ